LRIGERNYFICNVCGKVFACPDPMICTADRCVCDKCFYKRDTFSGCHVKEVKNKTLILLLKLKVRNQG